MKKIFLFLILFATTAGLGYGSPGPDTSLYPLYRKKIKFLEEQKNKLFNPKTGIYTKEWVSANNEIIRLKKLIQK